MPNCPRLSIVIPAYNEEKYLGACLDSLREQTFTDFEVIVVDNNSTDKTSEIAASKSTTLNLRVVHESQKGIAHARARGFAEAKNEIIVSTDSDCTFPPDWLAKIAAHFDETNPKALSTVAVYGIGVLNYNSQFQRGLSELSFTLFLELNDLIGKKNVCGFNFSVRKLGYESSEKFDTSLSMAEDVILGLDLMKQGTVQLDTSIKVFASPRRFESGSFKTLWTYTKSYFQVLWLNQKPKNTFEDIR